jgi:hypothetical protein
MGLPHSAAMQRRLDLASGATQARDTRRQIGDL